MGLLVEATSTKAMIASGRVQFRFFSFRGSCFHEKITGPSDRPMNFLVEATSTKAIMASGRA